MKKMKNIFSAILLIMSFVLFFFIIRIDLLPKKYLIIIITLLLLINIIEIILLNKKKIFLKIMAIFLIVITSIFNIGCIYYTYNTNKFFREKFKEEKIPKHKTAYNIYLTGKDFAGLSDFNMIITINTETSKILLTSIPRDYYIDVYSHNTKDKLSFISHDTDRTIAIKSLENFFDIKIDYYFEVDTSSLVILVDEIGGINYCSDREFVTTHSQVINTYNDTKGNKLYIKKGCQHLNGIQTLAVARERNAFPGRDRVRQANCQRILIEIFNKLKSFDTLTNYQNIMKDISESYTTDIPIKVIGDLVKSTLDGKNNWSIETQAVDGVDDHDIVHLGTTTDWVMYPSMDTVEEAKTKIKQILE